MAAAPGDIISYMEMCQEWSVSFQRGMHFHLKGNRSVVLMSRRRDAAYRDRVEDDGRILIYEGHDTPRIRGGPDPKAVDQPSKYPTGALTQNGYFEGAANKYKRDKSNPEFVAVYEKIHPGIWAFNGNFLLVDAWQEKDGPRKVFKFKLELTDEGQSVSSASQLEPEHDRIIPSAVKLVVWKRDKGCCVKCGATKNLHFDHDIPYSKGGSSADAKNIQLLCARHNLQKHDNIE
jgi:hypothetical protein